MYSRYPPLISVFRWFPFLDARCIVLCYVHNTVVGCLWWSGWYNKVSINSWLFWNKSFEIIHELNHWLNWYELIRAIASKLYVWEGILGNHIIGPSSLEANLNVEGYFNLTNNKVMPNINSVIQLDPLLWNCVSFQQDGAPPYCVPVQQFLDNSFPDP